MVLILHNFGEMGKNSSGFLCFLGVLTCVSAVTPIPTDLWQPPQWVTAFSASGNCVYMTSEPGDPIYQGQTSFFTSANSSFVANTYKESLQTWVFNTNVFSGYFVWPDDMAELLPGYYGNLTQQMLPNGSMGWEILYTYPSCPGEGWIVIENVEFTNGLISAVSYRFQYHCTDSDPALSFFLSWNKDFVALPGPTLPPADLWEPPKAALPSSGNYAYLQSQPGDPYYTFLSSNSEFTLNYQCADDPYVSCTLYIDIRGWTDYWGQFGSITLLSKFEKGYYVCPSPVNYALGSIAWQNLVNDTAFITGWYMIDEVSYTGQDLSAIKMRFEGKSTPDSPAVYGAINWAASNPLNPPGPVYPPPSDLWQPPKAAIPASGDYLYLEGQAGTLAFLPLNTTFISNDTIFSVAWTPYVHAIVLNFTTPTDFVQIQLIPNYAMKRLEKGYYANLTEAFANPATAGVGLMCLQCTFYDYTSWMTVDSVAYEHELDITELSVRFEIAYTGLPLLHGVVGWKASNPSYPQPMYPPPPDFWQPPASFLLVNAYCYVEVEAGYLSQPASSYTYTPANSTFSITYSPNSLHVSVQGEQETWEGDFTGRINLPQLEQGHYGSFDGESQLGWFEWSGSNLPWCDTAGWFAVDEITLEGGEIKAVSLRFQQYCQGAAPSINGALKWSTADASLEFA